MFDFKAPFFRLLLSYGIDISKVDFSTITDGELLVLSLMVVFAFFFVALCIRGIFYCIREICGSCIK